jgi:hypothetical protein
MNVWIPLKENELQKVLEKRKNKNAPDWLGI